MVYNEERSTLAFAASDVRYGMESNGRAGVNTTRYDIGGPNDIRLVYNPCGCVYEVTHHSTRLHMLPHRCSCVHSW